MATRKSLPLPRDPPAIVDQEIADVGRAFIGGPACRFARRLHETQCEPGDVDLRAARPCASSSIACR
jgi:hypothetical protein